MFILLVLGALLWRLQGGLLNDLTGKSAYLGLNDVALRLIWSFGMSLAFCILHPNLHWVDLLVIPIVAVTHLIKIVLLSIALLIGVIVFDDFGNKLIPRTLHDVVRISIFGIVSMILPCIVLFSPWLIIAGVLMGPLYWIGSKIPSPSKWMVWGEFFTGAVIGYFLSLS